jgi:hypothetical protein
MSFSELRPAARRLLILTWLAGALALFATTAEFLVNDTPYPVPWAWLSFLGMMVIDDLVSGSGRNARWAALPRLTLFAAIIVFRRHPEVTVLVALAAASLASMIKGQAWFVEVSAGAQWVLAAALGSAAFRLVGFGDTAHFVAASLVAAPVVFACGPALSSAVEAAATKAAIGRLLLKQAGPYVVMTALGAGLALAWRTASLQADALKVGELAVVGLLGVCIGFFAGGELSRFETNIRVLANWRVVALASVIGLVIVFALPGLAFVPGIVVVLAMGGWAVRKRVLGAVCGALGGLSNVAAVAFNGGRMPVVVPGPERAGDFTDSSHAALTAATRLSWLADRFPMPVFPGVASPGDALVVLGMVWLIVEMMVRRPRASDPAEEVHPVAA